MTYSLAVDIGGTFTDIVLRHSSGVLTVDKVLTTHHDLLEGFFAGVSNVMKAARIGPRDVDGVVVHATTIVTNVLIERKGKSTALLVTEGFRDVLHIRNEHRYEMYDPQIEFADPLVPAELTFGVSERVRADGTILREPDAKEVEALAATLKAKGVVSVAICFLNSYANPDNERAVCKQLAALLPEVFFTLSSEVAPQIREYPRASTAAVNAYAMPISLPYLRCLSERLKRENFPNSPLIMLSSGGVVGAETAGHNPARMIESGPAAGALAGCHYAEVLGIQRLMSFDMGGTTAKACLIEDGEPLITGLFEVDRRWRFKEGSGLPVTVPSIDMIEIGAGGGSIARVDNLGLLKVGPDSAGSAPGPACYGRGGTWPTVTDADLVLGLLDADNFLGGDMKLDRKATETAVGKLGDDLGLSQTQAARGIFRVVTEFDGGGGAHPRDRSRRRLARHATLRLRRRGAGPRLRGRGASAKLRGDRAAAAERAVGLWHTGDIGAFRSGAQRSRPRQRAGLVAGRSHPGRSGARSHCCLEEGRLHRGDRDLDRRRRPSLSRPAERTDGRSRRRSADPPRCEPNRGRVRADL